MSLATIEARNERLLAGVDGRLAAAARRVLAGMAAMGFPMCITSGARTLAEQQALYAQGRTAPGKVVTNCDGIRARSNHQVAEDGKGRALDFVFLVDADRDGEADDPTWDEGRPWMLFGAAVEAQGYGWGGRFKSVDAPHMEERK